MRLESVLRLCKLGGRAGPVAGEQQPRAAQDTVRLYKRLAAIQRLPSEPVPLRYSAAALRAAAREPAGNDRQR